MAHLMRMRLHFNRGNNCLQLGGNSSQGKTICLQVLLGLVEMKNQSQVDTCLLVTPRTQSRRSKASKKEDHH